MRESLWYGTTRLLRRNPALAGAALLMLAVLLALILPPGIWTLQTTQLRTELAENRSLWQAQNVTGYRLTVQDSSTPGLITDLCPVAVIEVRGDEVASVGPAPGAPTTGWNRYADTCAGHYSAFTVDGLFALVETYLDYEESYTVTRIAARFDAANGIPRQVDIEVRPTFWAALTGNNRPTPQIFHLTVHAIEILEPETP